MSLRSVLLACLLLAACLPPPTRAAGTDDDRDWSPTLGLDLGHLGSTSSLVVLGVAGLTAAWAWEETDETFPALQRSLDASLFDGAYDVGNVYGGGLLIGGGAAGLLAYGALTDHPGARTFGTDLARSFAASALVSGALKVSIDRRRPSGGSLSFPSGHTTSAFSTVPVIWHHLGWPGGVAAGALATLTACGRMEENRHYLSDVIAGAAIGFVTGAAVVAQRRRTEGAASLVVTPRSVGLAWSF
ncbi:MAG: phosphatase PAP2 family protein [Candidatus Krumholzibacteriia bacterium]